MKMCLCVIKRNLFLKASNFSIKESLRRQFVCRTFAAASVKVPGLMDKLKKLAADRCVDDIVRSGQVIGVGTGSTVLHVARRIGEKYRDGTLKDIFCIPTSFQSRHLILENKLPLSDLEQHPKLSVCIDGADEVDQNLTCIKGGGGCLLLEKVVMSSCEKFYIVADFQKKAQHLGTVWKTIPIEVVPFAYRPIKERIESTEGGSVALRMAIKKAGPIVTDNGNFILDWSFPIPPHSNADAMHRYWSALNLRLHLIPGLLETGLFVGVATRGYFGMEDGTVEVINNHENSPVKGLYCLPSEGHFSNGNNQD